MIHLNTFSVGVLMLCSVLVIYLFLTTYLRRIIVEVICIIIKLRLSILLIRSNTIMKKYDKFIKKNTHTISTIFTFFSKEICKKDNFKDFGCFCGVTNFIMPNNNIRSYITILFVDKNEAPHINLVNVDGYNIDRIIKDFSKFDSFENIGKKSIFNYIRLAKIDNDISSDRLRDLKSFVDLFGRYITKIPGGVYINAENFLIKGNHIDRDIVCYLIDEKNSRKTITSILNYQIDNMDSLEDVSLIPMIMKPEDEKRGGAV